MFQHSHICLLDLFGSSCKNAIAMSNKIHVYNVPDDHMHGTPLYGYDTHFCLTLCKQSRPTFSS